MKFSFLTGDFNWQEYGGKWVSKRLNNGDWDYWLVIEFINMWDATSETDQPKYNVRVSAVSPDAAGQEGLDAAYRCCGLDGDEYAELRNDPLAQVQALSDYGIAAYLWNESGNNANALLKQARQEAQKIDMLFGFYMDRPENRIGNTGWDFITGNIGFK